jgi:large subunit ribosomal protein L19e
MTMNSIRRMAAYLLKCGESRVRILDAKESQKALTRDDVRDLINKGFIVKLAPKTNSRENAKFKQERKRAGRRRGKGSKKGSMYAGVTKKDLWMSKVRSQRKVLGTIKPKLAEGAYKKVYRMIKGANFKSKKVLELYLKENNLFGKK